MGDGIGGDQAEGAPVPHQVEGPPVEVRHEVRVAVALGVHGLEPVVVASDVARRDGVLARERRVPDECVEAGVLAVEHLGELDLPVEGGEGRVAVALLFQPREVVDCLAVYDCLGELAPPVFTQLRFRLREERGQHQVTEDSHRADLVARVVPEIMPFLIGDLLARLPDAPA